jgi:hypothetical protein
MREHTQSRWHLLCILLPSPVRRFLLYRSGYMSAAIPGRKARGYESHLSPPTPLFAAASAEVMATLNIPSCYQAASVNTHHTPHTYTHTHTQPHTHTHTSCYLVASVHMHGVGVCLCAPIHVWFVLCCAVACVKEIVCVHSCMHVVMIVPIHMACVHEFMPVFAK